MKRILFFVIIVLVGTNFLVTGQVSEKKLITSQTEDDLFPKVSLETILKVIKEAQTENGISNIDSIYPGQRIRYKYPDGGGYFTHTVARGEIQIGIVRNYLTIPDYDEIIHPKRPTYNSRYRPESPRRTRPNVDSKFEPEKPNKISGVGFFQIKPGTVILQFGVCCFFLFAVYMASKE